MFWMFTLIQTFLQYVLYRKLFEPGKWLSRIYLAQYFLYPNEHHIKYISPEFYISIYFFHNSDIQQVTLHVNRKYQGLLTGKKINEIGPSVQKLQGLQIQLSCNFQRYGTPQKRSPHKHFFYRSLFFYEDYQGNFYLGF